MTRRALLTIALLALLTPSAWGATSDIGIRTTKAGQTCAQLFPTPVAGASYCFYRDGNILMRWNGSVWEKITGRLGGMIDVSDYGAALTASGATNKTAFTNAFAAVPAGGAIVWLPPVNGCYRVNGSVIPPANVTLLGGGYGSCIDIAAAGWAILNNTNFGILQINNSDITVQGIRIKGSTTCGDSESCPKLVAFGTGLTLARINFFGNRFQDQKFEAVYPMGTTGSTTYVKFHGNHFTNIGNNTTNVSYALQLTMDYSEAIGNTFNSTGGAIANYGAFNVVSGNIINGLAFGVAANIAGIYAGGEGNPDGGGAVVTGNVISFTAHATAAWYGIELVGTTNTNHPNTVIGNTIRIYDNALANTGIGIYNLSAPDANIRGNTIELYKAGTGIGLTGSAGGVKATVSDNTIRIYSVGAASYGIQAVSGGGGKTLTVQSSNNKAYGFTTASGSYAYYYVTGAGTLTVNATNDWKDGGSLQLEGAELTTPADNIPFSARLPLTSPDSLLLFPQIGALNFRPYVPLDIATGVLTISGSEGTTIGPDHRTLIEVWPQSDTNPVDDLDTITGGQVGDLVILRSRQVATIDITVKQATGNIVMSSGRDFHLTGTGNERLILLKEASNWVEVGRSYGQQLRWGATSVADGGTIAHGMGATPTSCLVSATTSGEFASRTGLDGTNITISLKKHDGTAGTTALVDWDCKK